MTQSETACPWSFKLFFSVDLIGSTSYKAQKTEKEDDSEWCDFFNAFLSDFPSLFAGDVINFSNKYNTFKNLKAPELWKFLGDEILFYVELTTYKEIAGYILAFKNCLLDYNKDLKKKKFVF